LRTGQQWRGQFLEAYFVINLAYARLVALRRTNRRRVPKHLEEPVLNALEQAITGREKLEDQTAPYGLVATPVYRDGFAVDIRFSDVNTARSSASSASVVLTFRPPTSPRPQVCKI
jgi:hypothetical protein